MEPIPVVFPGVFSLVKQSLFFYKKHYKQFILIGLVPVVIGLVSNLVYFSIPENTPSSTGFALGMGVFLFILSVIMGVVGFVTQIVSQVVLIRSLKDLDVGAPLSIEELYRSSLKLFFPFLWVTILVTLIYFGAGIFLIIPGIAVSVYLVFSNFFVVLENKRGLAALSSSFYFIRGNWWKVFGRLLGTGVIFSLTLVLVVAIIGLLFSVMSGGFSPDVFLAFGEFMEPEGVGQAVFQVLMSFFASCIILPISMFPMYALYKHVKSIKPEPVPETDFQKSRKWFLGLSIWGLIVGIVLIVGLFVGVVVSSLESAHTKALEAQQRALEARQAIEQEIQAVETNTL